MFFLSNNVPILVIIHDFERWTRCLSSSRLFGRLSLFIFFAFRPNKEKSISFIERSILVCEHFNKITYISIDCYWANINSMSPFLRWQQYWHRWIWSRLQIQIVTNYKWNLLLIVILATSRMFVRHEVKLGSPLYCLNLAILRQWSYLLALMDVCVSKCFKNLSRLVLYCYMYI